MVELAGKDATEGFVDVGHSQDARTMLKKYLIGEVPEVRVPFIARRPGSSP